MPPNNLNFKLTSVVLSLNPPNWPETDTHKYVYYQSVIKNEIELHAARMDAFRLIKTEVCHTLDDDDIYNFAEVYTEGISYGDEIIDCRVNNRVYTPQAMRNFSPEFYLKNPWALHMSTVYNTEAMFKVLDKLPQEGNYVTNYLLNFLLCAWKTPVFNPAIKYTWVRKATGFHTKVASSYPNSVAWLEQNWQRIVAELKEENK